MKNAVLLLTILSISQAFAVEPKSMRKPSSIPDNGVMVGGSSEFDACGGSGVVVATTTLFGWDKKGQRTFGKVELNEFVSVCGESEDGEYVGIVFGSKKQDCKVGSPIAIRQIYQGPCKSGWIKKSFFEFLAG